MKDKVCSAVLVFDASGQTRGEYKYTTLYFERDVVMAARHADGHWGPSYKGKSLRYANRSNASKQKT
eukprot:scaffold354898_cov19-Prasinocladus_malaysianus.AAC.2